jgi:dUTP pyrophosphatase
MKIQLLHDAVMPPVRATPLSAGFDLFMPAANGVACGESKLIGLGFATEIPQGYVALLLPRSSAGAKGLELVNTVGVIDADYRGEWLAWLRMSKPGHFGWQAGERVLQAVLVPRYTGDIELVDSVARTERTGGLGSTGH